MKKLFYSLSVVMPGLFFAQVGVNTVKPQGVFHVDGAKDNPATAEPDAAQQSNDFVVKNDGTVGIGTTAPNASAILDLNSKNKGFLAPRVLLSGATDIVTIPNPSKGLLVYNDPSLGTGLTYNGYVFFDGKQWLTLDGKLLIAGKVDQLNCTGITMFPETYTGGKPFNGTVKVPYVGGNGGVYSEQTLGPVNGLTLHLPAGNFAYGSGELIYTVTGTPTVSSPATSTFNIGIGGQACTVSVGGGKVYQPGEYAFFTAEIPANDSGRLLSSYPGITAPLLGGKIRIDPYFRASSNGTSPVSWDSRVYNISSSPVKIWFAAISSVDNFANSNILVAPGGYVDTDNGLYLGYGSNDSSADTPRTSYQGDNDANETETIDFVVDGVWFRVTIFIIVDNKNTPDNTDNVRKVFITTQRMSGY